MSVCELRTERLLLRPFRESDAPAIATYAADEEYLRYLGPDHPTPEQFVANNLAIDWEREHAWVVCQGDALVGAIFLGVSPTDRTAELACLLAPPAWGQGIGSEAARAVIDHAFATLGIEKVFARADAANRGSIRGMETLGMQREGVLRSHRVARTGERVDEVIFAILRAEWVRGRSSPW